MSRALAALAVLLLPFGPVMAGPPLLMSAGVVETAPLAFHEEEALLTAALDAAGAEEKPEAARSLAAFYHRNGLGVETLAALGAISPPLDDPQATFLAAHAEYGLGRYRDLISRLTRDGREAEGPVRGLYAMALARLGALDKAADAFLEAAPPSRMLRTEFYVARAAAVANTDAQLARAMLAAAGPLRPGSALRGEAAFIEAMLLDLGGDHDAAQAAFATLAAGDDAVAARAGLALVRRASEAGEIEAGAALEEARALSLRWRGGAAAREALSLYGALAGDAPDAFAALRFLAEHHPQSDLASDARVRLTGMMTRLASGDDDLTAGANARLFYEMIDYAPPGADGDALIRRVADRLAALDLLEPAAELLEHQVFQRLRGAERSVVASDLAALYLRDRRPSEALRVIASTRIAGLDESENAQRRLIEARALLDTGESDLALALIGPDDSAGARRLRADAHWSRQEWSAAAFAYQDVLRDVDAPYSAAQADAAVRAASAYVLADDAEGFAAYRDRVAPFLGESESALITSLSDPANAHGILGAYRRAYPVADPNS